VASLVWFLRLDKTAHECADLEACIQIPIGRSLGPAGPALQVADRKTVEIYYRTPNGRWFWSGNPAHRMKPGSAGIEVPPEHVDRALRLYGQRRPDDLISSLARSHPRWNRNKRELTFKGLIIRSYARDNAPNQFKLLDAFQASGWSHAIESPFKNDERQLRETVAHLQRDLAPDCPISFRVARRRPVWNLIGGK
jgi:hypothetical protein